MSQNLVLHGAVVLLLGFLGGFFFARAIKRGSGEVAWRVVHSGSAMGGILLIAIAPVIAQLTVSEWIAQLLGWSLILGVDIFVLGMVWAAVSGKRGLSRGGDAHNRTVWACYAAGTGLSLLGCCLLVYGAALSI
jgi:FtsH-binding integral membrane protein